MKTIIIDKDREYGRELWYVMRSELRKNRELTLESDGKAIWNKWTKGPTIKVKPTFAQTIIHLNMDLVSGNWETGKNIIEKVLKIL